MYKFKLNKKKTNIFITIILLFTLIFVVLLTPCSPAPTIENFVFNYNKTAINPLSRSLELKENEIIKINMADELQIDFYCYTTFTYRDVKHTVRLSEALQRYTYNTALIYGVDYELILSIIGCESGWDVNEKGDRHYIGLGMISIIALPELKEAIGTTNLADPKQNIEAICYLMSKKLADNNNNVSAAIMSYNHGQAGAEELFSQGIYQTKYSKKVLGFQKALKKVKEQIIVDIIDKKY
ncbi:MAG: hypothetical protein A2Y15_07745 [Clostridiales bacterium GWF2_36_10]|nr:MAG: hypothetical protein A2Y15_07745 [Clostridiales bacterium GWF2_36_10]HAN21191.1 hypothetical protein [Clostridiales bacterium]